jgi:sodium-dependent phosphate transporter
MIFGTVFEMLGAITVGARTAETIKNGIIPTAAFKGDAGVQMLAFTCALAGASMWVMWCTKHSAHVSSTYSLISAVAGVGVATVGAEKVQWGWNNGKGLGAIFAGLAMAPAIAAGFGATIFMLIKVVVHLRKNPVPWAIYTSPLWFLIAGTICTLSIVYKGSPNLGLNKKPKAFVAGVTMGTGGAVALLAAIFFVPFVYARIINRDHTVKWYMFVQGPLLFKRTPPANADRANVPNYAVVQDEEEEEHVSTRSPESLDEIDVIKGADSGLPTTTQAHSANEKSLVEAESKQHNYQELMAAGQEKFHARLRKKSGPLGWAMRTLHDNPIGPGEIYEFANLRILFFKRVPAMVVVGALYGLNYDIHAAQSGIHGTPEGKRMQGVYDAAKKYPNEVEHTYSFVQVLTACTASFAHGANDIGNSVGPWAVIYGAWNTGSAAAAKAPVPVWQLAVLSLTISFGLVTYGYNIMKVMGNKITYHSPSRGTLLPTKMRFMHRTSTNFYTQVALWRWALPSLSSSSLSSLSLSRRLCALPVPPSVSAFAMEPSRLSTGSELASWSSPGS